MIFFVAKIDLSNIEQKKSVLNEIKIKCEIIVLFVIIYEKNDHFLVIVLTVWSINCDYFKFYINKYCF